MKEEDFAEVLRSGSLSIRGRLPWSTNYTFLVDVGTPDGELMQAVYKPSEGERPLEDFPPDLYRREVMAYRLSLALGWPNIACTIEREHEMPHGVGSLQRFVDADFEQHYFSMREEDRHVGALVSIATFDLITNNADRKSGHCLLTKDGTVYAIDHGLCFHREPKLRTVLWDFADSKIPSWLLLDIERVARMDLGSILPSLTVEEVDAVRQRMLAVIDDPHFPAPTSPGDFPWPLV